MINLTTKISKKKALEVIRKNRTQHEADYKEATKIYMKELEESLTEKLNQVQRGLEPSLMFTNRKPSQYLKEYDSAIKMLEMTTDKTIELDPQTFNCLINDEWLWKHDFLSTTGLYLKK